MREPFVALCAIAAPIDMVNVDTDQIIPLHRLAMNRRGENSWSRSFFYNHRFDEAGGERSDFVLNMPEFRNAQILVAADNFGCGSSREVAVTAMKDFGVRAVIAPSFGDIFFANCAQNGILAILLSTDVCTLLRALLAARPGLRLTINLPEQTISIPDREKVSFEVDPMTKDFLLEGLDELEFTRRHLALIEEWEREMMKREPWSSVLH